MPPASMPMAAVFEPLFGEQDAIISDALNHASIIDGIRLCKAKRFRYANNDMNDLEAKLKEAKAGGARRIVIATDGVFSMDGFFADLKTVRFRELADKYDALNAMVPHPDTEAEPDREPGRGCENASAAPAVQAESSPRPRPHRW